MKRTKWVLTSELSEDEREAECGVIDWTLKEKTGRWVCDFTANLSDAEPIASAPEMLETLEMAKFALLLGRWKEKNGDFDKAAWEKIIDKVNYVIDRAKGMR